MQELLSSFRFTNRGNWTGFDDDSAYIKKTGLTFTTDSFIVDPIFFPGGDIGHLAMCGTINDLAVMGAKPLGISLGFIIEEGFPLKDLIKIIRSIDKLSAEYDVPIATGDTKVMPKNHLDKMIINTSGVGIMKEPLTKNILPGDKVIVSGGIGEHAVSLLSKRFDFETDLISDSKPIIREIMDIIQDIKIAKDPTRGGLASVLNEISEKYLCGIVIDEESVPIKKQVKTVANMLGINPFELACEGRFICIASNASLVIDKLKKYNSDAAIIGTVIKGEKVIIDTRLGKRILPTPSGIIVPRIC